MGNAMRQATISANQFPNLLPQRPDTAAVWGAFSLYEMEPPSEATLTCSDHILALVVSGTCRLRREVNGRVREGSSGPGLINLAPARVTSSWAARGHRGPTRKISVFVPAAVLSRVLAEDWDRDPSAVEILDRFLVRDPIIESVMTRLALEAQHDATAGRLYAESACEFLAHHIVRAHSSLAAPPPRLSGGLPPKRLARVLDYIEDNLAQSLTLYRLADVAAVSPRHFERAFRQALGVAPHAYVLGKRVATAQHILQRTPRLSVETIAQQVGFSSASHLASAFRRRTGLSPTAFRALHAR